MSRSVRATLPILALLALAVLVAAPAATAQPGGDDAELTRLLRFPDVHGDRVVFTYAGDLWTASTDGGAARRLTAHPGQELFARFSPDGEWIAFTGQYDGDEQVYVMPADGGEPKQLTYYPARGPLPPRWGYDHLVYGWTPDGSAVLFRSLRYGWDIGDGRLYTVSVDGGLPVPLPMPSAGAGDFAPDAGRVVYSPLSRDFRSWKRYAGGWAQDLYVFDLESHETVRVTDHPRTDRDPMWIGDEIFFASDRTGTLNLFAWNVESGELRQVTDSTLWDVRWPAAGPDGRIVYELDGRLHLLDTAGGGESKLIPVEVPSDLLAARPRRVEAAGQLESVGLSPAGERAVVVARGDVFTLPAEEGPTRNLTATSGAHEKHAAWSPDGRRVLFVSDADGEEELYLVAQNGSGEAEQITDGHSGFLTPPAWAPDGEHVAFGDQTGRLWVLRLSDRTESRVADDPTGAVTDYAWSPDGGHLAFSVGEESGFSSLHVWSAGDGETRQVTESLFNEFSPAWGTEGDYLYFLGDRSFAPQIGSFEWNYVLDRETYIYALALRQDVPHPFPPQSDEVKVEEEDGDDDAKKADDETAEKGEKDGENGDGEKDAETPVRIDFDGLADRLTRVPVEADNYGGLSAKEGHLIYLRGAPFFYGGQAAVKTELRIFSLEDREEKTLATLDAGFFGAGYALSADGSKVLVRDGGSLTLYDATPAGGDSGKPVSTAGLAATVDPPAEWAQILDEVWRRYRDYFYVENMHGYDWQGLRQRYESWLDHVAHRSDLNYLIAEMIAELSVSHAYIAGGDFEIPDRPPVGLPGARFELDADAGRYRIAEILPGHNAEPRYRSPLTEVGVDVAQGDYLLAIDGEELGAGDNPYRLLRYKADRPVTLTVSSAPTTDGAREVTYDPVTSEDSLRYLRMVLENRRRTLELSDGRVGYLHIPDMGASGIYEFIKWFYPQINMDGLVVDVRGNGGGNVSQMLIERLRRDLLATGFARNNDFTGTYPNTVFHGPLAAILNETSASDGDIFPAMFKKAGLGPLIGKRSWGGVIGISGRGPLIDGGQVFVPEFGFADPQGQWIIEGRGVEPDIEVENPPPAILEGRDPQLERAVEEVLRQLEEDPQELPDRPAPPVKTQ